VGHGGGLEGKDFGRINGRVIEREARRGKVREGDLSGGQSRGGACSKFSKGLGRL